jgi:hypothetical protein
VIVDFLIWMMSTVVELVAALIGLIPVPDPAPVISAVNGSVGVVFDAAGALAFWVPFGATGAALLVVAGCAGVAFGIKVVRIVASFLTLGGGSAA